MDDFEIKLEKDILFTLDRIRAYERNKAIDDCKSVILQTLDNEILVDTLYLRLEQLKEGAGNDKSI